MEKPKGSIVNYQESCIQLRRKILETRIEVVNMRNMNEELLTLLKKTCKERDEARAKLTELFKIIIPSISNNFQNPYLVEMLPTPPSKANSSITYCNSPSSQVSSPPPEFSNTNNVANWVIDDISEGRVLPQKGKLLNAVMEAGPLLHTLLLAGHLPCWRNPPPFKPTKTPPFHVKEFDSPPNSQINSHNCVGVSSSSTRNNAFRLMNSIAKFKNWN